MGDSRDFNLDRELTDVEHGHSQQGGVELLSAGEESLWFRRCLVAKWLDRRRSRTI
jgi:hypothetical protein